MPQNQNPSSVEQLQRDIGAVREIIEHKIDGNYQTIQEHFAKIDQQFHDQTAATALALSAADKAIENAFGTALKAVAKAELAAEKTYLESQIAGLREAFVTQIIMQKEALVATLASSDKAVQKAEVANEKRFESVNEFRSTLADQQRDLATKSEVNLRFKALEDRINDVVENSREIKGRSTGRSDVAAWIVAAVSVAVGVMGLIAGFGLHR